MQEPKALNSVAQFHRTFRLPIEEKPIIPAPKRCELRINLLQEELNELKEAIEDNDIIEVADALADIQYVLSGAILEFGLGEKFDALFSEVQRSNMSKTCKTMEEALATKQHYEVNRGMTSEIEESNGEFLVFRVQDGKVLKSLNYSPADLKNVLES
jgi:predicted HAD superfamily Cof-like phosphohydrolase